jgi:NhaA family Na+:H+ antiporter
VPGSLVGNIRCRAEGHSMTGRRTHVRFPFGRYLHPVGDEFVSVEALGGIALFVAAVGALVWANTPWSDSYSSVWGYEITLGLGDRSITYSLREWINEGLMTVFFFVVGVEIKRELVEGELSEPATARLPVAAALGGMIVPALIYFAWNPTGSASRGWGIPMATDLAFALGLLALLGSRVTRGSRLFLLTLAIVDDIVAIVVIAIFYAGDVELTWTLAAMVVLLALIGMTRLRVHLQPLYVPIAFVVLWVCTVEAGFSGALIGAVLGFITPARSRDERHVLHRVEAPLHLAASFAIVPLFALANAGVSLGPEVLRDAASSPVTWGIATGLVVGKLVGIAGVAFIGPRIRLGRLPSDVESRQLVGIAAVAGIGFTVSLFVAELAFDGTQLDQAKVGILGASLVAAAIGSSFLLLASRRRLPDGGG